MATLGEVQGAQSIGKRGHGSYIWQACSTCGGTRWVQLAKGSPVSHRCADCAVKRKNRDSAFEGKVKKGGSWYATMTCPSCSSTRLIQIVGGMLRRKQLLCQQCLRSDPTYREDRAKEHFGEKAHSWNGGRRYSLGYIIVLLSPESPYFPMVKVADRRKSNGRLRTNGYVHEHRLVMAQHLGRCLHPLERVHHVNGIRDDNRIENLRLHHSSEAHSQMGHREIYEDGYRQGQEDAIKHMEWLECLMN